MPKEQQKPGTGTVFRNDREGLTDQPSLKGSGLDLNGQPVKIELWEKSGRDGATYYSIRLSSPFGNETKLERSKPAPSQNQPGTIDDLPF